MSAAPAPGESVDARLARIEEKLDQARNDETRTTKLLDGHSSRLGRLERFMWLALGMGITANIPQLADVVQQQHT